MRANIFPGGQKTVATVFQAVGAKFTPLKRGVNGRPPIGLAQRGSRLAGAIGNRQSAIGNRAFTLLELLTVIAIIGILAAIIGPNLGNFKPNATAAATEQLLTDIGQARQLAMSKHTTVFMVFVPPAFWNDQAYQNLDSTNQAMGLALLDKQMTGYNFVSLRNVGDQPGQQNHRYWSSWKTLPEGTFIPAQKFTTPLNQAFYIWTNKVGSAGVGLYAAVSAFSSTTNVPFPNEQSLPLGGGGRLKPRFTLLPYIAFNYLGQLVNWDGTTETLRPADEIIPLAKGRVSYPRDPATHTNVPPALPTAVEVPLGNSTTNSFNLICIDRLTGRAYVKRQEIQ